MANEKNNTPLVAGGVVAAVAAGLIGYQILKSNKTTPETTSAGTTTENSAAVPSTAGIELNLWDQEEAENTAVIDTWIQTFSTENPGIKITRQTYPNEDLRTKFTTAATAGQAAELVWGPNDVAGVFATANLISPVDTLVDVQRFTPAALEAVNLGGKYMGVPVSYGNHLLLIYNKSLVPEAPKTTDELIAAAKKLTVPAENKFGLAFFQNEPFFYAPFMGAFDAWPLGKDAAGNTQITLNSPGNIAALNFLKDLKFKHKITPNECDYDCAKGLFLEGKAAFTINGDWSVKEFRAKLGDNLGIAALPIVSETNKPMTPMVSGRYVFVNAQIAPEKAEAVKKFVNFLASKPIQLEVASRLKRIPATREATEDAAVVGNAEVKALIDGAINGKAMPAETEMRAAWDAMRPNQQKLMSGEFEAAKAADLMQKGAVEQMASLKK